MARLIGGIFGMVSGKVGDVVYRRRFGKTIACALPSKRTTPLSEREIALRTKFAFAGKIAKTINSIEILKHFWKPNKSEQGTSCNKIFKNNYRMIEVKDLSGEISVVPMYGFNLNNPSITIGETNILIECQSLRGCILKDKKRNKYITAAGIIVLRNPIVESRALYEIIPFKSEMQILNMKNNQSFNFQFTGAQLTLFQSYAVKKAYAAFITTDEKDNPIKHSVTFSSGE
ncbi:MAG: hypothetical protein P4L35_11545 [Ignavibacteriaceae bacterium]|nr:hypothetical protein [Ignavibacteriaceae bacterium]